MAEKVSKSFYELIFLIRQDVASTDVDKIASDFESLIAEYKGNVVKKEYWGLRTLAYEIDNNKKAHYYFIGMEVDNDLLKEMNRKIKLSESIIRSSIVKVDAISMEPSPVLRSDDGGDEETVDVTS